MTPQTEDITSQSDMYISWWDGFLGILAGSGAGLCCVVPVILGVIGLSGLAGITASMPFVYHIILQWVALGILVVAWSLFLRKWLKLPKSQRWNRISIFTGLILIAVSVYVIRSWTTHVLI